jgi:hypothetical protein
MVDVPVVVCGCFLFIVGASQSRIVVGVYLTSDHFKTVYFMDPIQRGEIHIGSIAPPGGRRHCGFRILAKFDNFGLGDQYILTFGNTLPEPVQVRCGLWRVSSIWKCSLRLARKMTQVECSGAKGPIDTIR